MPASITRSQVRRQLRAMACARFELGVRTPDGWMLLRTGWTRQQIDEALPWLRWHNARGADIYIRPCGPHHLSLVDDLTREGLSKMRKTGFEPAVVVETSPDNFQAWLKHGRVLDKETSTCAAKELARRFHGDSSSADWRHFGRLAGFTNGKKERRLPNGLAPFVQLRHSGSQIYSRVAEFLDQVASILAQMRAHRLSRHTTANSDSRAHPITDFHSDARYSGDLHRADMAWALHAASRGLTSDEIRFEIIRARDLSKKGNARRQLNYADRTADKAVRMTEVRRP